MRNIIVDPFFPSCPIRNILARIGEKWTLLVLLTLDENERPMRFKEIQKAISDISQKMLSKTLHDLCADGLVKRTAFAEVPPRVEYQLTERARTLLPHLHALEGWALDNLSDIIRDRQNTLAR